MIIMNQSQRASTIFAKGQRESLSCILTLDNNLKLTTHELLYVREMALWWRKVEKRPWLYEMTYLVIVARDQWKYLSQSIEE